MESSADVWFVVFGTMKTSVTEIQNLHGECDWLLSNFKVGCVDGRIPVMSSSGISCHNLSASFFLLGAPGCSRRRAGVHEPSFHAHLWFHWMYMTAKVQPNEVDIFSSICLYILASESLHSKSYPLDADGSGFKGSWQRWGPWIVRRLSSAGVYLSCRRVKIQQPAWLNCGDQNWTHCANPFETPSTGRMEWDTYNIYIYILHIFIVTIYFFLSSCFPTLILRPFFEHFGAFSMAEHLWFPKTWLHADTTWPARFSGAASLRWWRKSDGFWWDVNGDVETGFFPVEAFFPFSMHGTNPFPMVRKTIKNMISIEKV